jgi:hypothetical protein
LQPVAETWGTASTLNSSKCTKYKKDGTLKAKWNKKIPGYKTTARTNTVSGNCNAFAQIAKWMAKLEKTLKKHTKTSSCKKKRIMTVVVIPTPNRKLG